LLFTPLSLSNNEGHIQIRYSKKSTSANEISWDGHPQHLEKNILLSSALLYVNYSHYSPPVLTQLTREMKCQQHPFEEQQLGFGWNCLKYPALTLQSL